MPSTSDLKAALKALVEAIPEERQVKETSEASSLLYDLIEGSAPGPDRLSGQMIMALDPPEEFAAGVVVAAIRLPVDLSLHPKRHVIVVRHEGERESFSVHEVSWNSIEWTGGQGQYQLGYAEALRRMLAKAAG
jgi:hypothetical protein